MTIVSIKQDNQSGNLTIDSTLGGTTKQLVPGRNVKFEVGDGKRFLALAAVSGSTGDIKFKLSFTKAQRWNGNAYFKDTGHDQYRNLLSIYVPRVIK